MMVGVTILVVRQPRIGSHCVIRRLYQLQQYLEAMTGAKFTVEAARVEKAGIHVGLPADFPWLRLDGLNALGPEGFFAQSDGKNLLLIARSRLTFGLETLHGGARLLRQVQSRRSIGPLAQQLASFVAVL